MTAHRPDTRIEVEVICCIAERVISFTKRKVRRADTIKTSMGIDVPSQCGVPILIILAYIWWRLTNQR